MNCPNCNSIYTISEKVIEPGTNKTINKLTCYRCNKEIYKEQISTKKSHPIKM